jgi:Uma2 family endonuclease
MHDLHPLPRIPRSLSFRDCSDDKPYVEVIHGRSERKMSPKWIHSFLQPRLARWLMDWAVGRGRVGTEWRFYFIPGENKPSSLVPDVAYVSYERLPRDVPKDARERPRIAPDIAVEIWSPGDRKKSFAEKVALYLAHGAQLVIVVYPADAPEKRQIAFHGAAGVALFPASGVLCVPGYEDLVLDVDALFEDL